MYKIKFLKREIFITLLVAFILFVPLLSLAQNASCAGGDPSNPSPECCAGSNPPPAGCNNKITNPLGKDGPQNITSFIQLVLTGVIKIGMPVIALAIIYCGFLFVKAQGKPDEINKAKDALLYTLIGAALLLGAWAIAQLISDTIIKIKA